MFSLRMRNNLKIRNNVNVIFFIDRIPKGLYIRGTH